jgi:hypothetical protein
MLPFFVFVPSVCIHFVKMSKSTSVGGTGGERSLVQDARFKHVHSDPRFQVSHSIHTDHRKISADDAQHVTLICINAIRGYSIVIHTLKYFQACSICVHNALA